MYNWVNCCIGETSVVLCTYTGDSLTVCGELLCEIVYDEQKPLRSSWLAKLRLNWSKVFNVKHEETENPNAKQRLG